MTRSRHLLAALASLAALCAPVMARAQTPLGLPRAYYWNIRDGGGNPAIDAERIAKFRSFGVSEVHIWLNENARTKPCDYRFAYVEGGARLWTPARLAAFTQALKTASIKPVYILSPDVRTRGYIASLATPSGPLAVAARVGEVDIELDIEGNGEQAAPCPVNGLTRDAADTLLIETIRAATPTSKIIISSTRGHVAKHPALTDAADAISPQLYGAHYAYTRKETADTLAYFRRTYPTKPLWIGLSVECSVKNAAAGLCSRALLEDQLKILLAEQAKAPDRIVKYVVWGEREAKPCPATPLCSIYATEHLKTTATSP